MLRYAKRWGCGLFLALAMAISGLPGAAAQTDEMQRWLSLPPNVLGGVERDQLLEMLRWERMKAERLLNDLEGRRRDLQNQLRQLNDRVSGMESQIPRQLSFIDQETRSQLVGKCLEQLLAAQLELAATEAMVEAVRGASAGHSADDTRVEILKTKLQSAASMLQMAQDKLDQLKGMREGGFISAAELTEAQMAQQNAATNLQILELELQAAQRAQSQPPADSRLGELQITAAALRAKIDAANRFLTEVGASSDIDRELRALRNERSQLETAIDLSTREVEENALKGTQIDSILQVFESSRENRAKEGAATEESDDKSAAENKDDQ